MGIFGNQEKIYTILCNKTPAIGDKFTCEELDAVIDTFVKSGEITDHEITKIFKPRGIEVYYHIIVCKESVYNKICKELSLVRVYG